ncbi:MAG: Zn-dependent hydrolase [Gemmatimonadetes bacterium]|nr:Zn-dependent hydrolase [Gemmatimonadota bacterium]MBA3969568.1 Zn-dependent hydrolase [Gemmatimonadota bacterium]
MSRQSFSRFAAGFVLASFAAVSHASAQAATPSPSMQDRLAKYTTVRLTSDLSALSPKERQMIPLLIDAGRAMDEIFWMQAYGDKAKLLGSASSPAMRRFVEINYGPWDRLDGNKPFVPGVGEKPKGANFYPANITKQEFEKAVAVGGPRADSLKSLYTLVRRDARGNLTAVPYSRAYAPQLQRAAGKLREAAKLAEDPGLRQYLELRATSLLTDSYQPSDLAWMDMKNNTIDVVIGPIETYEDQLFGYKAANETFVLIKDQEWSGRLARYVAMLPALQQGLPVAEQFKQETPGTDSDLNAYDAVYYAGDANAGSKTIAINLPNDEEVQLKKGTRRLQLKNSMRAKFDKILIPIARELIVADQQPMISFDAFFGNVMFHEVAHGLGIKNTINNRGTVREALKERASALEEGKADILGLYMVQQLNRQGELKGEDIRNNYVTFLASLFRSIRFGASSAHGRANVATFNYLAAQGAFTRGTDGKYRVDFAKMEAAMNDLARDILVMQGNGDYEAVGMFQEQYGKIGTQLQADLNRLATRGIPVDIVFEQGMSVLQAAR